MGDDAPGAPSGGARLFGRVLVATGAVIGALSGLCTGGGLLVYLLIISQGLSQPSAQSPPVEWSAALSALAVPIQFGALPLGLAGVLIYLGRLILRAPPSRVLGGAGVTLGALIVLAALRSALIKAGMVFLTVPYAVPGIVLIWIWGQELTRRSVLRGAPG